jgi:hypothetical protein
VYACVPFPATNVARVVKAGPKADVSHQPVPADGAPPRGAARACWFAERLVAPKGVGARKRLRVRPWQRQVIEGVLDPVPRPRSALWRMPRGNGKSAIAAALGLCGLYLDEVFGASVVVVARDERQARIVFGCAVRMVEMQQGLTDRTQLFQDKLVVPGSGSAFQVLPAAAADPARDHRRAELRQHRTVVIHAGEAEPSADARGRVVGGGRCGAGGDASFGAGVKAPRVVVRPVSIRRAGGRVRARPRQAMSPPARRRDRRGSRTDR